MALAMGATIALTSCSDPESEGKSRITYYPTIELIGDKLQVVEKGKAYEDPGYTSTMAGNDVTDQVVVTGNVDTSKSGLYTLTYTTVKNSDGFGSSTSRTVFVCDPNDPKEGFFANQPTDFREYNGNKVAFGDSYNVIIYNNGNGTYYVDDLFGGWYAQRAGYGENYKMKGTIAIADDGTLSLVSSRVAGWGDGLDDLSGKFDAETGTYNVVSVYNGNTMFFNMTWTKQ